MNKKTIVVNLFAGPGAGKSTTCAGLFSNLKMEGVNCEMALEFAKDKVWEESFKTLDNQIYIFGKQLHRMFRLKDKVDLIITDAPLLLSIYYDKLKGEFNNKNHFHNLVLEQFNTFDNINIFINRNNSYQTKGRMQSKEDAIEIDTELKRLLNALNINYFNINKGEINELSNIIKERLNLK